MQIHNYYTWHLSSTIVHPKHTLGLFAMEPNLRSLSERAKIVQGNFALVSLLIHVAKSLDC